MKPQKHTISFGDGDYSTLRFSLDFEPVEVKFDKISSKYFGISGDHNCPEYSIITRNKSITMGFWRALVDECSGLLNKKNAVYNLNYMQPYRGKGISTCFLHEVLGERRNNGSSAYRFIDITCLPVFFLWTDLIQETDTNSISFKCWEYHYSMIAKHLAIQNNIKIPNIYGPPEFQLIDSLTNQILKQ